MENALCLRRPYISEEAVDHMERRKKIAGCVLEGQERDEAPAFIQQTKAFTLPNLLNHVDIFPVEVGQLSPAVAWIEEAINF